MQVLRDLASLETLRGPVYLAIGIFDGVHRGHQALIEEAQSDAAKSGGTAVVMTFEPHPMMFFRRDNPPLRLSSPQHKERLLQKIGVTHLAVLSFDSARAGQTAEEFIADLQAKCHPLGGVVVGAEWRFGKGRTGDVALLKRLGNFEVDGIPAVMMDGQVISSTVIRQAVAGGDLAFAAEALGRPYAVFGKVVKGKQLGQQIGFPTANVATDGLQLPPDGVYAVRVRVGEKNFAGVANLGLRPTVEHDGHRMLEVNLLEFDGDLYGMELEVEFMRLIRGEKKFANVEELQAQIARDVASVRDQDA